ncbi:MAG TPA: response regulator [Caulobacteraceae bacterium]|nr:response regulator [Caulobacteraceae bacterium]
MTTPSPRADAATREWRDLVAPVALLLVLAAMTAFMALDNLVLTRTERGWVSHSRDVIEATQGLFSSAVEVESAQRAYAFNGDAAFLEHFDADAAAVGVEGARLRALVADNPPQRARVALLIASLDARVALSRQRVALYRAGQTAQALAANPGEGKAAMDRARAAVAEIMQSENGLLAARTARANGYEFIGFVVALLVSALAIVGLAAQMLLMARANRQLARAVGEREAAESSQRESEAGYRAIFANSADLLSVIDVSADGGFRIAELNPAYEQATGVKTDMLRGVEVRFMAREPESTRLVEHLQRVVAGGVPVFTRDPVNLLGGRRIWESILVPVRNDEGRIDRIVASSRDVTEREESQARLRRAQRMEAVGHLTGGVAHDFNNILQIIRGNLELVASAVSDPEASERIKNALHGADRAAELTRQLLAFARRQPLEPRVVNLGRLVGDMAEMLRRTLGEAIEVETVIAGGLWNTLADPAQVESAVLNLALNARDAMPKGGRLTIEITNAVLDQSYANHERVEPGQYVMLAVSDTGQGMTPETLARAFEPFFTTKGEERGTGLGLSMVYGFVKQSNGHVQIYSEPGEGTTVKIYLPRSGQSQTAAPQVSSGALTGLREVVLVVEDDDLVRASTVGMLRELGYTCIHASDGAAALDKLRAGAKVDLLFTDVVMPGPVKSRDLAREAQALHPGLPVLFTSGYSENAIVHQGRLDEGVQLLSKPFSREDLARKIRSLLQKAQRVVLVVEDDALVRMAAVDMIESLGFGAAQAGDAEEALAILNASEQIDILFTDIGLPGVRGPELAAKARALRPGLKVVFASGYGETEEAQGVAGARHLDKPYQQSQLAEVLDVALASVSAR